MPLIVVVLGKLPFWFVRLEAIALSRLRLGLSLDPARRRSVTRSWYAIAGWSFAMKVSIAT